MRTAQKFSASNSHPGDLLDSWSTTEFISLLPALEDLYTGFRNNVHLILLRSTNIKRK